MPSLPAKWLCRIFLVIHCYSLPAYAQINIKGRVLDEKDDTPLKAVSVYFNNTTIGTYTNLQGDFHFEAIRLPGTELVIFAPGYEIMVFKPTAEQVQGKKFVFKLMKKEPPSLDKLALTNEVRKSWFDVFKGNFLGLTEEASKSRILNESAVYFSSDDNKSSLMAFADTPLVIINSMLGYKISFNLLGIWYDIETGQNSFLGYSRYDEIDNSKKSIKNRKRCYGGSTLHFYHSLLTHQLYQQGFGTFLIKPLSDTGATGLPAGAAVIPTLDGKMAVPITESEILYIDSTNNLSIRIEGQLLVQYDKEPSAKEFYMQNGLVSGILSKGVESYILFKRSSIGINGEGVLSDADSVAYSGYWIYEKIANILPYNYTPD